MHAAVAADVVATDGVVGVTAGTSGNVGILVREDTHDAGSDYVMGG